jgi:hypothetical protein
MRGLRETMAESYIAGVAIAVLLLWAIVWGLQGLWLPLYRFIGFLLTAIDIFDFIPRDVTQYRMVLFMSSFDLFNALVALGGAWLLSNWVYGIEPLRGLRECHARFVGRNRA